MDSLKRLMLCLCIAGQTCFSLAGDGRELMMEHCSKCHLPPEPGDLPKASWPWVVGWMAHYLGHGTWEGIYPSLVYPSLVVEEPQLSKSELQQIEDYLVAGAPEAAMPSFPRNQPLPITPQFLATAVQDIPPQTVTLAKIHAPSSRIFIGGFEAGTLFEKRVNEGSGKNHDLGDGAVDLRVDINALEVVLLGSLHKDKRKGTLLRIEAEGNHQQYIKDQHRCSGADWSDFDGDGNLDVLMAGFGEFGLGELAWYRNENEGRYDKRVLSSQSGALRPVASDLDGDGDEDILCLFSQGRNEMWRFENKGSGNFAAQLLWKKRAGFGYNGLECTDFNGDGKYDIIVVSGNNMELGDYPLKPYHGVYVHLQQEGGTFEEAIFLPLDGAGQSISRDFDGDGDIDIAAISSSPDWRSTFPLGFVYFENKGGRFSPSTISPKMGGRFLTMDAGDIDGDGDDDILLGGSIMAHYGPLGEDIRKKVNSWPSAVVLWNQRAGLN